MSTKFTYKGFKFEIIPLNNGRFIAYVDGQDLHHEYLSFRFAEEAAQEFIDECILGK
jgi:hypothetical protein